MSRESAPGTIRFDDVVKTYGIGKRRSYLAGAVPFGDGLGRGQRFNALERLSFEVSSGESVALIGANGAGKSTALKCLARVTRPTTGRVTSLGRITALIELGAGFHLDLSGLENARFAAALAGVRGRAAVELIDKAVEFSEIGAFIDTPVKRYSSGMFARLSFAVISALPSDILIVDEVLAVGDLAFQRKCFQRMAELRKETGVTLVFVSHNGWALKDTCDRGLLIEHGQLQTDGPIADVLEVYYSRVDVTEGAQASSAPRVKILSATLDPLGVRLVPLHGSLKIEVSLEVSPDIKSPVLGLGLFDQESRLIWGIYSDEEGLDLHVGTQSLAIEIDDVALPGACRLQIFTMARGNPVVEDVRNIDLEVGSGEPHGLENGLVHVRSQWTQL